jgi:hypothetical protein
MVGFARLCTALLLGLCAASVRVDPPKPIFTITVGAVTKYLTAAELLSRSDLASVQFPPRVNYDVSLSARWNGARKWKKS